jgi:hypothetical protein
MNELRCSVQPHHLLTRFLGKALLPKSEPKAITGREKTACARIEMSLEARTAREK